jgi:hypothetical protein
MLPHEATRTESEQRRISRTTEAVPEGIAEQEEGDGAMRLKEFFERLPMDGWELQDDKLIRRKQTAQCPVCAANGNPAWTSAFIAASNEMGLGLPLASAIAEAADAWELSRPTIARIRRLLLKHCNLTEPQQ